MSITRQLTDHEIKVLSAQGYSDASSMSEEDLAFKCGVLTPLLLWEMDMKKSDAGMPRYLEDLITTNSLTMTPEMKVRYDAKIKIRGERP